MPPYITYTLVMILLYPRISRTTSSGSPSASASSSSPPEITAFRQCETIRIEMCRKIGYNETSMPNLVGHEMQTDVEYTLQTFAPLIEYDCSSQLKLFLCAAYVPMCTPKAPVHAIGPCRSLCESVRIRCHPVLQGFGFPWPPALDCERFPRENNHETMCMEGPGEMHQPQEDQDLYGLPGQGMPGGLGGKLPLDCSGLAKSHLYVRLPRSGRCAPLCEADILFTPAEKHLAEIWVSTWAYAALGLALVATVCLLASDGSRLASAKWSRLLSPLIWCHNMVTLGWAVRFVVGRTGTACGTDPQAPNESLLTVDGLSNASCASVFLMRYYFGMAACAWWAVLCLGWHRDIRRHSPDSKGHVAIPSNFAGSPAKRSNAKANAQQDLTQNNFVCFVAWGLPAFQTAAVLVARFVDADELLGACFVGNQSDKALQILVATPVFCYWIFGSMNLISGYLVHCRTKEILRNSNALSLQQQLQQLSAHSSSGIGIFLFIYGLACALLLLAVIYEFANIDVWLGSGETNTPLWPFLVRAFMELMLGICCFAWVLGPSISTLYKRQVGNGKMVKQPSATGGSVHLDGHSSSRGSHAACNSTVVSYHSVRPSMASAPLPPSPYKLKTSPGAGSISLNQMSNYSLGRSTHHHHQQQQQQQRHSSHHHHQQQQQHHHHHHHSSSSHRLYYPPGSYASQKYSQHGSYYPHLQHYGDETLL
ncbi:frizzled-4 [Drosophila elegans]|uniref:frizzled-4 n=1 Tax=Drosophila elegans TaxID=30023 RepID=UPI0007E67351|nr:frizzled-4 [Drosophila elegans]